MSKKLIYLTSFVLVLSVAGNASADLMAHWRFNEAGGDTVEDSSGNGNQGIIQNAEWVEGRYGTALQFDGQSARVVVHDSPSLHSETGDITIAAWIKVASDPKSWSNAGPMVFKQDAYQWNVNSNGALWFGIWGARLESIGTYDLSDHIDEWHHATLTFEGASQTAKIYVDGELNIEGTVSEAVDPTTDVLYIGFKGDGGTYFDGVIDEVRIYDHVLSEVETLGVMEGTVSIGPIPANGEMHADTWASLSWLPGDTAVSHDVYFGDDFDDVDTGDDDTFRGNQTGTVFTVGVAGSPYPDGLVLDTTYYWRIDEVEADNTTVHKGDVWSFRTMHEITITDPDLICWWRLDEGFGTNALDWSGHGHDGTFSDEPLWVDGYDGGALDFDGVDDSVIYRLADEETWSAYTVAVWAKAGSLWQSINSCVFANHTNHDTDTPSFQLSFDSLNNYQYHGSVDQIIGPVTTDWIHLAVTCDGPTTTLYYNGDLVVSISTSAGNPVFNKFAIGMNRAEDNWFDGTIDNLRIYKKVLTQIEIELAMRGDPLVAWGPNPADGAKYVYPDVELSWSSGLGAQLHIVYFSDNFDDMNTDAEGFLQEATTYTPGPLESDKVYYWRVDEFDGTVMHTGEVWSFKIKPFIPITDPNLVGWWTLEEGAGTVALDWSGHGHDVTFRGNPQWVDGYDGGALNFSGNNQSAVYSFTEETWSAYTVALWAKAGALGQGEWKSVFSSHIPNDFGFQLDVDGTDPGNYRYNGVNGGTAFFGTVTTNWVHIAVTSNGVSTTLYFNGNVVATIGAADAVFNKFGIGINRLEDNWFEGIIDDVRVYNRELTQEEIQYAMRGDPLLAWNASPANR